MNNVRQREEAVSKRAARVRHSTHRKPTTQSDGQTYNESREILTFFPEKVRVLSYLLLLVVICEQFKCLKTI